MDDDFPSVALFWTVWYNAAFFEVEVLFFNFHFVI